MLEKIIKDCGSLAKWLCDGFLGTARKKEDEPALVHLYAGSSFHSDGYVLGNRLGLKKLRAAIDAALMQEGPDSCSVFTGDGEGYRVFVVPHDEPFERWDGIALPYTAEDGLTSVRRTDIWPEDLVARFRKPNLPPIAKAIKALSEEWLGKNNVVAIYEEESDGQLSIIFQVTAVDPTAGYPSVYGGFPISVRVGREFTAE